MRLLTSACLSLPVSARAPPALVDVKLSDWKIGLMGAVICPLTGVIIALIIQPILQLPPEQFRPLLLGNQIAEKSKTDRTGDTHKTQCRYQGKSFAKTLAKR